MRIIQFTSFIVFSFLLFASCKKEDNSTNANSPDFFTLAVNGTDPLIGIVQKADGSKIFVYGKKDQNGKPTSINNVMCIKGGDSTRIIFNEQGKITQINAENGCEFFLDWQDSRRFSLIASLPEGNIQVNTEIDLDKKNTATGIQGKNIRKNQQALLSFKPTGQITAVSSSTSSNNCLVNINSCGAPANQPYVVSVIAKSKTGRHLGIFPASPSGTGQYQVSLPSTLAPRINPSEVCTDLADKLGNLCKIANIPAIGSLLCIQLSAAIASTGIGATVAAPILAACEASVLALEFYCMVFDYSPVDGVSTLAEKICKSPILDREFKGDVILYASIPGIPYNSTSTSVTIPNGAPPFPTLQINLNGFTKVNNLNLQPSSPTAGQSYIALARAECLVPNTEVRMSITGTDGYTNSQDYTISMGNTQGEFSLVVPGAESQIRDVVTLRLTKPDGQVITRQASLVFN